MPDLSGPPSPYAAVVVADIHLSHKPPVARSGEQCWYSAMRRPLSQLRDFIQRNNCPLVVCGDLFHLWNPPPELINWAMLHLPKCYTVPGQHDLPHHSLRDIRKSAYWTLVQCGSVINLEPGKGLELDGIRLWGFPWGVPVESLKNPHDLLLEVAVIHQYVCTKKTAHQHASPDSRVGKFVGKLTGFDVAFFGDNHIPFRKKLSGCEVVNCGSLMRRTSDQRLYNPAFWALRKDGTVEKHYLNVEDDVMGEGVKSISTLLGVTDTEDFARELLELSDAGVNFPEAVKLWMNRESTPKGVRKVVLEALEKGAR